jgi:stearoyl-CoA desaturase (Delta-9 desaturase)
MFDPSLIQFSIIMLIMHHINTLSFSLYLHRHWAHRSIKLHKSLVYFFEFWLWFVSGALDPETGNVHRQHHKESDTPNDPHSPSFLGIKQTLFEIPIAKSCQSITRCLIYPFVENETYHKEYPEKFKFGWKYPNIGMLGFLFLSIILFGLKFGIIFFIANIFLIWVTQITVGWGVFHLFGYTNYDNKDTSKNVFPLSIFFVGEELHNNHHRTPGSAKFSKKWFEFDVGYMYIKILNKLNLCEIKNK